MILDALPLLEQLKAIATVRSVGASTRIEGSRMSDEEVEVLLRNTDITKLEDRDSQEVVGYFQALDLIAESYAEVKGGEVWLVNSNVPEYSHGNRENHEPKRPRKLLLNEREIEKMHKAISREGMTLVPLSIYFNGRGRAKVELAIGKGRKHQDKREYEKEKDWKRESARILRDRG